MKISELTDAPAWLQDADTDYTDVEIRDGVVIWHGGNWHNGVWHNGVWRGGTWHGGNWHGGNWHNGVWRGGTWHGGTWHGGYWHNGVWHDGTWHGGTWRDGMWHGGTWHGGASSPTRCKWCVYVYSDNRITIGCKTRTVAEWDEFFAGEEVFDTPRGTEAFELIETAYQAARAALKHQQLIGARNARNSLIEAKE